MMLKELIEKNRSYRRFYQDVPIPWEQLQALLELACLSPSGANLQPLKYIISIKPDSNAMIFDCLGWANYLKDWPGPPEGERPAAYIVILHDTSLSGSPGCDHGIAAQSILLGAVELGWGGCMMGAVNREKLAATLAIPNQFQILLVLALGKPKETVVLEPVGKDGDIRYWRESNGVHHVPKRPLDELILRLKHDENQF